MKSSLSIISEILHEFLVGRRSIASEYSNCLSLGKVATSSGRDSTEPVTVNGCLNSQIRSVRLCRVLVLM